MTSEPREVAIRTALVAGFSGSVLGASGGPPGAIAGGLVFGTAGYVYGYKRAEGRREGTTDVETA